MPHLLQSSLTIFNETVSKLQLLNIHADINN